MESSLALDTRDRGGARGPARPPSCAARRSSSIRDEEGKQHIVALDAGDRPRSRSAAASRPTSRCRGIRECRACTREFEFKAGEWTVCDDGWSQNGTLVNGLRLDGRAGCSDGDLVRMRPDHDRVLRPGARSASSLTLVPGELSATPRFSEQQQRILRALCRPLFGDGEGSTRRPTTRSPRRPASRPEDGHHRARPPRPLVRAEDMPSSTSRAEIALLALRSGLVSADDQTLSAVVYTRLVRPLPPRRRARGACATSHGAERRPRSIMPFS